MIARLGQALGRARAAARRLILELDLHRECVSATRDGDETKPPVQTDGGIVFLDAQAESGDSRCPSVNE
jgi:hypothetical protein